MQPRSEIPQLPYEFDALQPYISAGNLDLHYRNFYLAYNAKLMGLIYGTRYENADLRSIIREADGPVFYNATQVWNHSFYFFGINSRKNYFIDGRFEKAIRSSFRTFGKFKEEFINYTASITGQGWVWLIVHEPGSLKIIEQPDAESPLRKGLNPILALDLCDHAYHMDYYQNRTDYIESFWNLINWEIVGKRYMNIYLNFHLRKQLKHVL